MGNKVAANQLTPVQFLQQIGQIPHKLSVGVWNLRVKAADEAVNIFKKSFEIGRFNTKNSQKWAPRTSKRQSHPVMNLNLILKNSIKRVKTKATDAVYVRTDPKDFYNGLNTHAGFCYAGVHNAADNSVRTGDVANMPRRQFMGDSSEMDEVFKKLTVELIKSLTT